MTRLFAALVVVVAIGLGAPLPAAIVTAPTRLNVPAALLDYRLLEKLRPFRGASRDRSLHGKARRLARRSAA